MKKFVLGSCLGLALASALSAQNSVEGYVYEDTNQNGKKERNEKGIAQVAVTNGEEVVLTDQKGKYTLPIGDDQIISVIKPRDYQVAVNANNLPQFFYIHKPKGSPQTEFKGVPATGKLPRSVDFGLTRMKEKEEFTALIFGDPQPYTIEEVNHYAKGVVSELKNSKNISFGLSLGDLVGNDLSLFNPYIKATQAIGVPWYNVLGNHDLNFDVNEDVFSDETYEAHFGPANYAFNVGKVHFIVLDDVLYPDPRDQKGYWGGLRKDQLTFIENDLKHVPKDHLIVLAFHIPLSEPDGDAYRDEDRIALFELLKDYPNTLSLSAHTHIQKQDFFGRAEGWLQDEPHHHYNVGTTSGDWYSGKLNKQGVPISTMRDGTPKGYAFIHFRGNEYQIKYQVAGRPADYQMEVFHPKVVEKDRRNKSGIYVNFFIGSEKDSVMYRVDQGDWKPMKNIKAQDPAYEVSLYEWDLSDELLAGRRGSNAIESTHLWYARIPTKLDVGNHTIEIQATDMFGNSYTQKSSYRVALPKQ